MLPLFGKLFFPEFLHIMICTAKGGTFMKQIIDFPCIPFAQLPTPLYKLENLS